MNPQIKQTSASYQKLNAIQIYTVHIEEIILMMSHIFIIKQRDLCFISKANQQQFYNFSSILNLRIKSTTYNKVRKKQSQHNSNKVYWTNKIAVSIMWYTEMELTNSPYTENAYVYFIVTQIGHVEPISSSVYPVNEHIIILF